MFARARSPCRTFSFDFSFNSLPAVVRPPRAGDRDLPVAGRGVRRPVKYPRRHVTTLLQTDHAPLARAIELAEQGRGRTSPNPLVGAVVSPRRPDAGGGVARRLRRPARRGRRAGGLRRRRCGRRDALRLARAVLPPGPDAAVHRRDPRGGDRARRGRLRRPDREGLRPRARDPARRGRRGGGGRRRARRARPLPQPGVPQARAHRPAAGAVQVRDDARRQGRHADRRLEVDLGRGLALPRPPLARRARRRRRSGSAPRWPTTRS